MGQKGPKLDETPITGAAGSEPALAIRTEAYVSVVALPDGKSLSAPSVDFADHAVTRYNLLGQGRTLETHDNCFYNPTAIVGSGAVPGLAGLYKGRQAKLPLTSRAQRTTLTVRRTQDYALSWSAPGVEKIYVLLESGYTGYAVNEMPPVGNYRDGTLFCAFDAATGQGIITAAQLALLVTSTGNLLSPEGRYAIVGANSKTLVQGDVQLSLEALRTASTTQNGMAEMATGKLWVLQ